MSKITLSQLEKYDLELLVKDLLSPLTGFNTEKEYRLSLDASLFPIPIVLSSEKLLSQGEEISLVDEDNTIIAKLVVEDCYEYNLEEECSKVAGSFDKNHPYTKKVLERKGKYLVGGKPVLEPGYIFSSEFYEDYISPEKLKTLVGDTPVLAFQTRNPLHSSHIASILKARELIPEDHYLLLNPVLDLPQPGDIEPFTRLRCYKKILHKLGDKVIFSMLPLAMRMLGPREAMFHAIVRRNYGCKYFLVGRDHAGPSSVHSETGKSFYGSYDAQNLCEEKQETLGIKIIKIPEMCYDVVVDKIIPIKEATQPKSISGTEFRRLLTSGEEIPEWFSPKEVVDELRNSKDKQGICFYFVGNSGAGKTTVARSLEIKLKSLTSRPVSYLDADIIRKNLSKGLGFSKEDRSTNVRRIGYLASEIVKHNGIVIVANIAPFLEDRKENRKLISQFGKYIQIHVNTSLDVCIKRDVKGIYRDILLGKTDKTEFEEGTDSDYYLSSLNLEDITKINNELITFI